LFLPSLSAVDSRISPYFKPLSMSGVLGLLVDVNRSSRAQRSSVASVTFWDTEQVIR
jgi:hypothetical protein